MRLEWILMLKRYFYQLTYLLNSSVFIDSSLYRNMMKWIFMNIFRTKCSNLKMNLFFSKFKCKIGICNIVYFSPWQRLVLDCFFETWLAMKMTIFQLYIPLDFHKACLWIIKINWGEVTLHFTFHHQKNIIKCSFICPLQIGLLSILPS